MPCGELWREIEALSYFAGEGMVRLLDADPDQGVLLLERLLPGTALADLEDDQCVTQVAARVLQQLWKPVPVGHSLATVAEWAEGLTRLRAHFGGGYGPFPRALVDRAEGLFRDLLAPGTRPVLLHGDMHPVNVLRSERQPWLAIDPKGVVGDPLYDVATLLNGLSRWRTESRPKDILERQAHQVAEVLGFDRERVLAWGLAQIVLAGWWHFEDHGCGWEPAFALAELYASLR